MPASWQGHRHHHCRTTSNIGYGSTVAVTAMEEGEDADT